MESDGRFWITKQRGVERIYKEGLFPPRWISFLPLFLPQSTPKTSLRTRDLISITVINLTLYLYDFHLNYFYLSLSHNNLKALYSCTA